MTTEPKPQRTPEPWTGRDCAIYDANDEVVVIVPAARDVITVLPIRDHIVACVNACAGIDPAAVEELVKAMKAHRDSCAASIEGADCDPHCCGVYLQETVDAIDAAFAKARRDR